MKMFEVMVLDSAFAGHPRKNEFFKNSRNAIQELRDAVQHGDQARMAEYIDYFFRDLPRVSLTLRAWLRGRLTRNHEAVSFKWSQDTGNFLTQLHRLTLTTEYDRHETWSDDTRRFLFNTASQLSSF